MTDVLNDISKDVRVTLEKMPGTYQWSWEVKVDGASVYGYENDYINADGMVQDALRDMGVDA